VATSTYDPRMSDGSPSGSTIVDTTTVMSGGAHTIGVSPGPRFSAASLSLSPSSFYSACWERA
jgi:hypothetical protein